MTQRLIVTVIGGVIVAMIVAKFGIAPKQHIMVNHTYGRRSNPRIWKLVMTLGAVLIIAGLVYAGAHATGTIINPDMYAGWGIGGIGLIIWGIGKFGRWITG